MKNICGIILCILVATMVLSGCESAKPTPTSTIPSSTTIPKEDDLQDQEPADKEHNKGDDENVYDEAPELPGGGEAIPDEGEIPDEDLPDDDLPDVGELPDEDEDDHPPFFEGEPGIDDGDWGGLH